MRTQLVEGSGATAGIAVRQMQRDGSFERRLSRVGQSQVGQGPAELGTGPRLGGPVAITDLHGERLVVDALPVRPGAVQATKAQFRRAGE